MQGLFINQMASKNKKFSALFVLGLLCVLGPIAQAQTVSSFKLSPNKDDSPTDDLVVTIAGQSKTITPMAFNAWIIEQGRAVLWSGPDGAGGFENEGQSLWRYDAETGKKRRVSADYFEIDSVREVKSKSGKPSFVVTMNDGGLGGTHLAVINPTRGIVWRQPMARLTAIRNGRLAVGIITEDSVNDTTTKYPKVTRMLYFDIDEWLKRKVIMLPHVG